MSGQTSTPDLTETEVIIIGCVCAAILIALLTVLVCIIIRRRKLAKQLPPQAPPNLAANGHAMPPQKPPRGYENTDKSSGNYYNEKQQDISFTGTPRSPTKERQFIDIPSNDRKGDFINCPESGYNTPDNPKPKKVIYEVVV